MAYIFIPLPVAIIKKREAYKRQTPVEYSGSALCGEQYFNIGNFVL